MANNCVITFNGGSFLHTSINTEFPPLEAVVVSTAVSVVGTLEPVVVVAAAAVAGGTIESLLNVADAPDREADGQSPRRIAQGLAADHVA